MSMGYKPKQKQKTQFELAEENLKRLTLSPESIVYYGLDKRNKNAFEKVGAMISKAMRKAVNGFAKLNIGHSGYVDPKPKAPPYLHTVTEVKKVPNELPFCGWIIDQRVKMVTKQLNINKDKTNEV